ncbi:MAG: enzyme of heme biosynthesis [Actinobacteria bacterium]|nr:enzyme of heme biosynthesis [Actinomycetota bacterium]
MKKLSIAILVLPIALLSMPSLNAADTGGGGGGGSTMNTPTATPTPTSTPTSTTATVTRNVTSELASIRKMIDDKNYSAALAALKIADQEFANNADINNLLGFSSRKLKLYKPAGVYYAKALKINPKHLGALEYQGELFVETKKTSDAKKNLAKLKGLCGVTCEEYLDLKKAIGKK